MIPHTIHNVVIKVAIPREGNYCLCIIQHTVREETERAGFVMHRPQWVEQGW